ncbi:hypothetical protein Tco_0894066 [Tanacetum coccineum]|uniref:Uncharacterized protein n=1 Tax=Tanacetum coccineum TaxID=301880 RepID=A0ABQ5CGZ6_9ASTR
MNDRGEIGFKLGDIVAEDNYRSLGVGIVEKEHTIASTKMKVIKGESEVLGLLKINDALFTHDTSLGTIFDEFNRLSGMNDDLFTYEIEIPGLSYVTCAAQQVDDSDDGDLYVFKQ